MEGGLSGDALKAAKFIIKATPAGEIQDVLEHLAELAGGQEVVF